MRNFYNFFDVPAPGHKVSCLAKKQENIKNSSFHSLKEIDENKSLLKN